jgi:hypothetical protein
MKFMEKLIKTSRREANVEASGQKFQKFEEIEN